MLDDRPHDLKSMWTEEEDLGKCTVTKVIVNFIEARELPKRDISRPISIPFWLQVFTPHCWVRKLWEVFTLCKSLAYLFTNLTRA